MVTNLVKVKAIIKATKSLRNRLILNINRSWSTKLGLTNRKTSNFTNKSSPKEVFEAVMSHLPRIVTIPFLTSNHRLLKTTKMTSLSLRFTRSSPLQLFQTLKLSSIIRERPLHSHLTKQMLTRSSSSVSMTGVRLFQTMETLTTICKPVAMNPALSITISRTH